MSDVIVLGDSHAHCLALAFEKPGAAPEATHVRVAMAGAGTITDAFVLRTMEGETVVNPLIYYALSRMDAVDPFTDAFVHKGELCLLFGFTAMHRLGYNPVWKNWRLPSSGAAEPPKPHGTVTDTMLDDMLAHELRYLREGVKLLAHKAARPIHLLPGPPPYRANDAIVASRAVDTDFFPDPRVRLAVWNGLHRHVLRWPGELAAEGVEFRVIDLPDDVFDAEGFLRPEFLATDGIHANKAYGEKLVRHLAWVFG